MTTKTTTTTTTHALWNRSLDAGVGEGDQFRRSLLYKNKTAPDETGGVLIHVESLQLPSIALLARLDSIID